MPRLQRKSLDHPETVRRFPRGHNNLKVRVGCHTGEVLFVGDYPHGVAVHTAARVVALAAADEVIVSSTTRDLLGGPGFHVEPAGSFELKGLTGAREVFRVSLSAQ